MKSLRIELSRFIHISLELILLYIVVLPYFLLFSQHSSALTYIALVILGIVIYEPFIRKYKNIKLGILLVPVVTAIGVLLVSYDLVISLLIALVLFWRSVHHHKEITLMFENVQKWGKEYKTDKSTIELHLFFVTFLVGTIYYLFTYSIEGREIFLYLVFLQFFLVLLLKVLNISLGGKSPYRQQQLIWRLGGILLLGLIAIMSFGLFKYFYFLVGTIIKGLLYFGSLLAIFFLYLLSLTKLGPREILESEPAEILMGPSEEIVVDVISQSTLSNILMIAAAILSGIVIFLIIRNTGKFHPREEDSDFEEYSSLDVNFNAGSKRPKITTKSNNEIRKLFLRLEKSMAKKGLGRKRHESVDDWFRSFKANGEFNDFIEKTYRKVRYGDEQVSKAEMVQYRRAIKDLSKSTSNQKDKAT